MHEYNMTVALEKLDEARATWQNCVLKIRHLAKINARAPIYTTSLILSVHITTFAASVLGSRMLRTTLKEDLEGSTLYDASPAPPAEV